MTLHKFAFPTQIHFGPGASALVAEHLKSNGVSRPLVVTDRALGELPIFKDFMAAYPNITIKDSVYVDADIPLKVETASAA